MGIDYSTVTEVPGNRVTHEQLTRMYHRYRFAANFCNEKDVLDVAILYEAIYYLPQPEKFFYETRRVLRENGVLLIATVNKDWPEFNPSPFSTRYFSVPELEGLLKENGFKVEIYGAFSVLPNGAKEKIIAEIRKKTVALHLIPKTMKGKEFLKKIFYGQLLPLKEEIEEEACEYSPVIPIPSHIPNQEYKVIYAV